MMVRNWWGGAANVPANVKLAAGTTAGLTYAPALGAAPSASAFAVTGNLSASATVGVNVTGVGDAAYEIGATALGGNPVAATLPSADTAVKYFDVYAQILNGGNLTTGATVDFYGTTASPVVNTATSQSAVLFYNSVTGSWVNAGGSINTFGNFVEIYVGTTSGSVVTDAQFNGTPFVLVTVAIPLGGIVPAATPLYPINGAVNVPVANLTFTWPAVSGSGVTYQFALAQASANTSANEFAILDYSDNTMTNAEPSQETLAYNTVYWWEVRAVTMNSSGGIAATGPWSIQMFTTMPMPTTTTSSPAVTITQTNTSVIVTQPVTTVQSTVTSVVITQTTGTSTPAIPSYLLWAVIAVGAILVIAVIVLIVRTRRIP
jgi:trimeric autotransporter adhesin